MRRADEQLPIYKLCSAARMFDVCSNYAAKLRNHSYVPRITVFEAGEKLFSPPPLVASRSSHLQATG